MKIKILSSMFIVAGLAFSGFVNATVNCSGVPNVVKVGETGAQEAYLIVRIAGKDYRLGLATDDLAKARFTLATSAVMSKSNLTLRFYAETSCDDASSKRTLPTSAQLTN